MFISSDPHLRPAHLIGGPGRVQDSRAGRLDPRRLWVVPLGFDALGWGAAVRILSGRPIRQGAEVPGPDLPEHPCIGFPSA